jgi:ATP-dependent DNA ligase
MDWKSTLARLPICRGGSGRSGALTNEKMKNCVQLKPELVARVEFAEWTPDGHLSHSKFVGLREDKEPEMLCANLLRLPLIFRLLKM